MLGSDDVSDLGPQLGSDDGSLLGSDNGSELGSSLCSDRFRLVFRMARQTKDCIVFLLLVLRITRSREHDHLFPSD